MAIVLLLQVIPVWAFAGPSYPKLEYYVTDQVGVLTVNDIYDIEDLCLEVDNGTGCEIAVLIVNTTQPDGIDLFAVKTFEESGIGKEGLDNGLLLMISVSEKMWRIEVGYGLEGILPPIKVNQIAEDNLEPFLEEGNYYEGILYTVAFLGEEILDNWDGPVEKEKEPWYPIPFIPLLWWQLLIVVLIALAVFVVTGGRVLFFAGGLFKGGGGGFGGGRSGGSGARGRF
ncbi:MAG: TPM domain-containing protein [Candidatus Thermoplasmatota archaeon]|nr:TPM domain-containing protein [Candidatus Thermoplasmatota archaeon]